MNPSPISPIVTKEQALAAFSGNGAALGRALGITRQSVNAWPAGPIEEGYALKLYYVLKPNFFQQVANDAQPEVANG